MTTSKPEAAVDSVGLSPPVPSEVATGGWNPYDVWRTRVLLPRLVEKSGPSTQRLTPQPPSLEVLALNDPRLVGAPPSPRPPLAGERRDPIAQEHSEPVMRPAGSNAAVEDLLFDLLDALRAYAARKTVDLLVERGEFRR